MRKQYLYNRDGLSQMLNSQLRQLSDSDIGLLFQMMKQLLLRQTPALTNIPAGITLFISMICIIVKSRDDLLQDYISDDHGLIVLQGWRFIKS